MKLLILPALAAGLLLGVSTSGCTSPSKSAKGFRLPDGNAAAGKSAFLRMQCNACHKVENAKGIPPPVADPPMPVVLGGTRVDPMSDGELVTSIIYPSHKIGEAYQKELVQSQEGESRMMNYGDIMKVQELVDIVAFLHTLYDVEVTDPSAQPRLSGQNQGINQ